MVVVSAVMYNITVRHIHPADHDGKTHGNENGTGSAGESSPREAETDRVLARNESGTHVVIYDPDHTFVLSPSGDQWNIVQCSPGTAMFLPKDISEARRQAIAPGSTLTVCMQGEIGSMLGEHPKTIGRGPHQYELSVTPVRRWCTIQ